MIANQSTYGRQHQGTNGYVWNGSSWVSSGVAKPAVAAQDNPAAKVIKYTQYYHEWTERAKQYEQRAQAFVTGTKERKEAQTHADWCKYYADNSSRAAHHFHSSPYAPPSFELPPAPNQNSKPVIQSATTSNKKQDTSNTEVAPDSLKRFVHRCMQQCKTEEERKEVQQQSQQAIAKALQDGTLHTKNWDHEPLLPLRAPKQTAETSTARLHSTLISKHQNVSSYSGSYASNSGHYGPASSNSGITNLAASSHSPPRIQKTSPIGISSGNGKCVNYYGPAAEALTSGGNKKRSLSTKATRQVTKKAKNNVDKSGFKRNASTLAKRASRFADVGGNQSTQKKSATVATDGKYLGKGIIGGSQRELNESDYEQMKVKGTCQTLEKQYLRLTAPPKAEFVRPLEILQQHLVNLKEEWKLSTRRDDLWFTSEMKSMRQDLTVQHMFNSFTVDVYETHARMALEMGDVNEFNQAQTQLKILYEKLEGVEELKNVNEFVAYRLIYFVVMSLNKGYQGGSVDLLNLMLYLTVDQRKDVAIRHALQLREAVAEMNFLKFFALQKSCPNLGGKLIERCVATVRFQALQRICKAYRPTVEVEFVLKQLGFETRRKRDRKHGRLFLLSCGCVLTDDGKEINAKESVVHESTLEAKRSLI